MQSFYFSESQDAMVLQTFMKKSDLDSIVCSWDSLILETASSRTHKPKILNESLLFVVKLENLAREREVVGQLICVFGQQ